MYKYGVIVSESSVNKYNIFAYPLCFEIKNRRQGPKTAGYRQKPAAISNPEIGSPRTKKVVWVPILSVPLPKIERSVNGALFN